MFGARLFIAAVLGLALAGPAPAQDAGAALKELAPSGKLRVGIAVGPAVSALWSTRGADGQPRGVTVDLGAALAKQLGVPVEYVVHSSSGEIIEAAAKGAWDVAFTPVDAERKTKVDFGPNYALGESTYLVAPGSAIRTIGEVDRPGVRVVGVENTATIRSARAALKQTQATGTKSLDEAVAMIKDGKADALALGRESLSGLAKRLPGTRILDGYFHATGTAIAVPKGKAAALDYVSRFMESAKADGTVRRAFDNAGMKETRVAPAGSRS
jgi:polar amino acid transport system substrate-binding protein